MKASNVARHLKLPFGSSGGCGRLVGQINRPRYASLMTRVANDEMIEAAERLLQPLELVYSGREVVPHGIFIGLMRSAEEVG